MTTGVGVEGAGGQHVVSMRSTDQGRTWEKIVPIEPADGPEASYAVLLKVPGGRIYAFYNHNTDRVPRGETRGQGRLQARGFARPLRLQVQRRPRPHLVGPALRRADPRVRVRPQQRLWRQAAVLLERRPAADPRRRRDHGAAQGRRDGRRASSRSRKARSSRARTSSPSATRRRSRSRRCPTATSACARRPAAGAWRRSRASSSSATARSTASIAPWTAGPRAPTAATAATPGRRPPTRPTRPAAGA